MLAVSLFTRCICSGRRASSVNTIIFRKECKLRSLLTTLRDSHLVCSGLIAVIGIIEGHSRSRT